MQISKGVIPLKSALERLIAQVCPDSNFSKWLQHGPLYYAIMYVIAQAIYPVIFVT